MKRLLGLLIISLLLGIPTTAQTEKNGQRSKTGTHPPIAKQLFRQLPVPVQQG